MKKIINILATVLSHWRSIGYIYFIQLIVAVALIGYLVYSGIDTSIGQSLSLDRLSSGFDRSVFSDLINEFPRLMDQVKGRFKWGIVLYMIISIVLNGGLLANISKGEKTSSSLLKNGLFYFYYFIQVFVLSLVVIAAISTIIWIPYMILIGDPLETFQSDKTFILTTVVIGLIYMFLISVVWVWSILTRSHIVSGKSVWSSIKSGWQSLRHNIIYLLVFSGLLFFLHILLTWIYTLVISDHGARTWLCVLGLILIQQVFAVLRIIFRAIGFTGVIAVD